MKNLKLKIKILKRIFEIFDPGLTLIEILLAVGIFSILAVGISGLGYLYTIFSEKLPQEQLRHEVLRQHQAALEDLKRNIRESGEIIATTTIDSQLYTTATTTLVLRRRAMDANGSVLANEYDRIVYNLLGTSSPYSLQKLVEPSSGSAVQKLNLILNNSVKKLEFSYNHSVPSSATAVSVFLVSERNYQNHSYSVTSTIKVTLH